MIVNSNPLTIPESTIYRPVNPYTDIITNNGVYLLVDSHHISPNSGGTVK